MQISINNYKMEHKSSSRKINKPEIKKLPNLDNIQGMSFGREVTPKKVSSFIKQINKTTQSRQQPELNTLKKQNNQLHHQNLDLLKQIKSLSGFTGQLDEENDNQFTSRKSFIRSRVKYHNTNRKSDNYGEETTMRSRKITTERNSIEETYQKQVAYLLKSIQERDQTINDLRFQLNTALGNRQSKGDIINNSHREQLQQKQQIIKGLMKRIQQSSTPNIHLGDTNQTFQLKKQNYRLKLKVNQLIHQLSFCKQQKNDLQSIICQLYFDNQIRTQQSQMVSDIQNSCQKTRKYFSRLIRESSS